jgi:hypothetical protein
MEQTTLQSELETLQLRIAGKKKEYEIALRNGKTFESLKRIYIEVKELEKAIQSCIEKAKQSGEFI